MLCSLVTAHAISCCYVISICCYCLVLLSYSSCTCIYHPSSAGWYIGLSMSPYSNKTIITRLSISIAHERHFVCFSPFISLCLFRLSSSFCLLYRLTVCVCSKNSATYRTYIVHYQLLLK